LLPALSIPLNLRWALVPFYRTENFRGEPLDTWFNSEVATRKDVGVLGQSDTKCAILNKSGNRFG
jgi:hypothetical protein